MIRRSNDPKRFYNANLGNPAAPLSDEILRICIDPFRGNPINAIGMHSNRRCEHYPEQGAMEERALKFVAHVACSAPAAHPFGYATSGSTEGNLYSLIVARAKADRSGRRLIVATTMATHYSVHKAMRIANVPLDCNIILDRPENMLTESQEELLNSSYVFAVCTYGDLLSGKFETPRSLEKELKVLKLDRSYVHIHVDAAYGGMLACSSELPDFGFDELDSMTVDFHKTARLPLSHSMVLLRENPQVWFSMEASYIPYGADSTIRGSRAFAEIAAMHAYTEHIGYDKHKTWVDEVMSFAKQAKEVLCSCNVVREIRRSANMIFVRVEDSPMVEDTFAAYNVSRLSHSDSEGLYRLYAFPEQGLAIWEDLSHQLRLASE
jgi:glutamate/tyrosine decarboxylase-like PLP-dependent enzyme